MGSLGRYSLLGRLAYGGMSELALAERADAPGRRFVLKLLLPHLASDPVHVRRFRDEAELGSRLRHDNIVPVVDFGEAAGRPFLAMEHVPGLDLGRVIERLAERGASVPLDAAMEIGRASAEALHYAHQLPERVVHHDVSPGNILLGESAGVKLIDFGLARAAGPGTGAVRGALAYSAPEALEGGAVDHRADVFSLGVVLHELVTSQRLFKRSSEPATLLAVVEAPIPRPSELRPGLPRALDEVLARALERDPERRYPSAAALGAELRRVAAPSPAALDPLRSLLWR